MRYVLMAGMLLSVTASVKAEFAVSTKNARNRHGPYIPAPFDFVLDINGDQVVLETSGSIKPLAVLDDGGDTLVSIDFDRRRYDRWSAPNIMTHRWDVDGQDVQLIIYPVRHTLVDSDKRIYASLWSDGRMLGNYMQRPIDFTEPMIAEDSMRIGSDDYLITGISGPRHSVPIELFNSSIGGAPIHVTLEEFGFGEVSETVLHALPEPDAVLLASILALTGLVFARPRYLRKRSG